MMKRLEGKVAIVTGASRGIGRSIALTCAAEGATVVVNYRTQAEQAAEVVNAIQQRGGEALAVQADTSDVAHIAHLVTRTVEQYGKIDILVSNAGIEYFGALEQVTVEDFDRIFAVNTRGQFFAMQQAAQHMHSGGRLICTSSISAGKGMAHHALYAGSKAAMEAIARNLAVELGPRDITVNAIVPGATATDMAIENMDHYSGTGMARPQLTGDAGDESVKTLTPLGGVGTPADIANVVAFLVSDEGRWITGQAIHATGGGGLGGW